MSNNKLNKLSFMGIFLIISLLFLNIKPVIPHNLLRKVNLNFPVKPKLKGIYVPPAEDSHLKCATSASCISIPNTWKNLPPDNNIPGLLPGPRPGEQLGLENNPDLSLSTPIKAPLVDNTFPTICNSNEKASLYYKDWCKQYNPYNGSYLQCTNNYVNLPPDGFV